MHDASCAEIPGPIPCEFNLSPSDIAKAYGCSEHYILNVERGPTRLPDRYFEILACLMKE